MLQSKGALQAESRRVAAILNRFGVAPADVLGRGSESTVYALDATQALRVYRPQVTWEYVALRQQLTDWVRGCGLPFAVPEVFAIGAWAGQVYTVEARIPGRDLAQTLPTLDAPGRAQALANYLAAAQQIGAVVVADRPFGELLGDAGALQATTWHEYLTARLQRALDQARPVLARDVPNLDAALRHVTDALAWVAADAPKRLVHGDFGPANVLVDGTLAVTGVADFGYSTVVGDPRLDWAGALAFLELLPDYTPAAAAPLHASLHASLHAQLVAAHGPTWPRVFATYRQYYACYFANCGDDDLTTYAWCVRVLREAEDATGW